MSPRKLTESDKNEILDLYRMPQETTSTLAERYSVSSSTISRFLKSRLPDNEYEELIQQKRLSRTPGGAAQVLNQYQQQKDEPQVKTETPSLVSLKSDRKAKAKPEEQPEETTPTTTPTRRSRRRRSSASETEPETQLKLEFQPEPEPEPEPELELEETSAPISKSMPTLRPTLKVKGKDTQKYFESEEDDTEEDDTDVDVHALEEMLGEDLADLDEDLDEDDEDDEDDWEEQDSLPHLRSRLSDLSILPLSEAAFPRSCYLVIDRAAELITRPLEEFSDLGDIPPEEFQQETLPVFDNHKIARRFSKRSQRVIKVPDSQLFQKTSPHLQAKGITRLLLDGQVYSLVGK